MCKQHNSDANGCQDTSLFAPNPPPSLLTNTDAVLASQLEPRPKNTLIYIRYRDVGGEEIKFRSNGNVFVKPTRLFGMPQSALPGPLRKLL